MRYEQVRNDINTGDLIAVRRKDSLLAVATRFFTRTDVTHVGIAIWIEDGLYLAELNGGGNHLIPMSQLANRDFDVYACPLSPRLVRSATIENLRNHIDYGFAALFVIGLVEWLKLKVTGRTRRIVVCSGYCMSVYIDAGWPEQTRLVSPGKLASKLTLKFSVRTQ